MAAICVSCCLFTVRNFLFTSRRYNFNQIPQVLTFIIDTTRFRYPERPISFVAICFIIVATAYIVGLSSGTNLACRDPFVHNVRLGRLQMISTITQVMIIYFQFFKLLIKSIYYFFFRVIKDKSLALLCLWHFISVWWRPLHGSSFSLSHGFWRLDLNGLLI